MVASRSSAARRTDGRRLSVSASVRSEGVCTVCGIGAASIAAGGASGGAIGAAACGATEATGKLSVTFFFELEAARIRSSPP